MGLFDVGIRKELKTQKDQATLEANIKELIKDYSENNIKDMDETITLEGFKTSILKYNLSIILNKTNKGFNLAIDGELQQFYVLILFVLIILGIIFTFGIAIIFIVLFAYLQKRKTSQFLEKKLEKLNL
jgi:ABC-type protease/lipase transport system fused ATPase/permease subunit